MKRRNFLSLLGAATTAPFLPALPAAATTGTVIKFNQFTYGLAALHTRIEPGLSVSEMARRFRLSGSQAEALAQKLVEDGFATRQGGMITAKRPFVQTRGMGHPAQKLRQRKHAQRTFEGPDSIGAETSPLLAHLHKICTDYGLTLSPRAARQGAIA